MATASKNVEIDGRALSLSNLDKPLYPQTGFTKGQVIDYYLRIAPVLVPHLSRRPLTLKRYPNGVAGMSFYEKNCPKHRPEWMKTVPVWSEGNQREMDYCVIEERAALVWTANLASIELHTSLSRAPALDRPTALVFDLDPGPPADALDCARVALRLRALLEGLSLESLIKSSGKKGLQVYVPFNQPRLTYEQTKPLSQAIAQLLERELPDQVVSTMAKERRTGKVFIDWSQNDPHKTTVSVYSLRAEPTPTVSTPLKWAEVEKAVKKGSPDALRFTADEVLARVARFGDLFEPLRTLKQRLPRGVRKPPPQKRAAAKPRLIEYAQKRDFAITSEPAPFAEARPQQEHPRFMIHKHHASRLHYDLRLEIDGALASWAVPKGPTDDPALKRLAVQTEDHPLAYGDFEGRIPEGQYGAGDSIIWDRGLYDTLPPGQASAQRKKGHLDLVFVGDKMKGRFHLLRTAGGGDSKARWLLFKAKEDEEGPAPKDLVAERPESVVSGREATRGPALAAARSGRHPAPDALLKRLFPPMLATLMEALPPPAKGWHLELKYDGYRALAALSGGRVALWSRNEKDLSPRFPGIAQALAQIVVGEAVIDGEIVALDEKGRPRFARLGEGKEELFVFDLLWLEGRDLRKLPIERRRELLESLLAGAPPAVHLSEQVRGDARKLLALAVRRGFEGLIAKQVGSSYEQRRSAAWVKLKLERRQELAIVGYTRHLRHPTQIGALLLGIKEGKELRYAGKVGTGFDDAARRELFKELKGGPKGAPLSDAPRVAGALWVKPRLVADVRFTEWTADHRLRHPTFIGLRPDKSPADCVRERARPVPRSR